MKRLVLLPLLVLLMGTDQCNTEDIDPEQFAAGVKQGFQLQRDANSTAELWVTMFTEPNFHPCMARDISDQVLLIAETWVDPIKEESLNPDGTIELPGGPINIARCLDMEGKPDPWPPLEPNPEVEAAIRGVVPPAFSGIKMLVTLKQAPSGPNCIQAEVWKAVLGDSGHALQPLTTDMIIGAVNGEEQVSLPPFKVNYSGCGTTFHLSTTTEAVQ